MATAANDGVKARSTRMQMIGVLLLGAITTGLLSIGGTAALAGPGNRPAVTVTGPTSTVTAITASVSYSANRGGKQLKSVGGLTCALTGPTSSSSCGTVATSNHTTTGTVSLAGLQTGTYTYTVTIKLTDGGTATSSASFTVTLPQYVGVCHGTTILGPIHGATDIMLTAPVNTKNNATRFTTNDGTCVGAISTFTLVDTPGDSGDADSLCVALGYPSAKLPDLHYDIVGTPYTWWECQA